MAIKYALCESVSASGTSHWHIRPLTKTGKHLGGGVDTASLCGHVRPPYGWDLQTDLAELMGRSTRKICQACLRSYQEVVQDSQGPHCGGGHGH